MKAVERLVKTTEGERVRLGLRNIYILPTRFGWLWLGGVALVLVVGIQTQINGPLLLGFLMLALFLLTLHLTHFNLQGLEISCADPSPGFAASVLAYPLNIRCPHRVDGLRLGLAGGPPGPPRTLGAGFHHVSLPWSPPRRGLHRPGPLTLQSRAPLGLFLCWSRWQPAVPQLIYPARRSGPVGLSRLPLNGELAATDPRGQAEGREEWRDLAPHRPEDGPSRLAWKLVAQGRGNYTKRFTDLDRGGPLLTPDPLVPSERALEHLCERICRLHGQGASFGLVLGERRIAVDRGSEHRNRCLAALATAP